MRGGASALACVVIAGFALVSTAQQPSQAAWEALLAEYEPQLKVAFPTDERYRRNIRVYCTADVTGNGTDEALVTLGYGGAYTGVHTLLRIESGVPTTTRLRRSSGIEYAVELLRGSSAKNVADFELHPNDRAISEIECAMTDNANEPETVACSANSFVWNAQTKLFEYDGPLSARVAGEYFRRRREQETSKYSPPPNQARVLTECGQRAADDAPRFR